jgi:membrane-associated PAP2 superfamily phosphatase
MQSSFISFYFYFFLFFKLFFSLLLFFKLFFPEIVDWRLPDSMLGRNKIKWATHAEQKTVMIKRPSAHVYFNDAISQYGDGQ